MNVTQDKPFQEQYHVADLFRDFFSFPFDFEEISKKFSKNFRRTFEEIRSFEKLSKCDYVTHKPTHYRAFAQLRLLLHNDWAQIK